VRQRQRGREDDDGMGGEVGGWRQQGDMSDEFVVDGREIRVNGMEKRVVGWKSVI